MIQTLRVDEFPPNLNELNRMHFMTRANLKETWEALIEHYSRQYQIQPVKRVSITLEFYFPDKRRRDLDNYGFAFKFILDGLVKAGILTDDSTEEVAELRIIKGGISKPKHILIHLHEVSA